MLSPGSVLEIVALTMGLETLLWILNLSLNGLKVISEVIGVEGYIASELRGGKYHDIDPGNINKTIREIRKLRWRQNT